MRVVLDSSVLVAATLSPDGPSGKVVSAALTGRLVLVTSESLLAEAERAIAHVLGVSAVGPLTLLREIGTVISPVSVPKVVRDSSDDHVVATAVAGAAEYIVSNDHDLLALNRQQQDFTCIRPQRLLELLTYLD